MKNDQLDAWLAELADADREVAPPPDLEARTMAAWDTWRHENGGSSSRHSRVGSRPRTWVVAALTGLAAALLVGLAIPRPTPDAGPVQPGSGREREAADAVHRETAAGFPSGQTAVSPAREPGERSGDTVGAGISSDPVSPVSPVRREVREPLVKRRETQPPAPSGRPDRVAAPPTVETASFVPLGPDVERELTGTFQLARIRVTRDVLVDLGLLMEAHRGGGTVQADVVFGEDGLARAIRLAPVSGRMP